MDMDLLHLVCEDLNFLFDDWNQDIDDASLRRSSSVLGSLLVEGKLAKIVHFVNR